MTATVEPATSHTQAMARCPLNPIELMILRHLADGATRHMAAHAVHLSPTSMGLTINRIFHKTDTVNTTSAVAHALRKGWIA